MTPPTRDLERAGTFMSSHRLNQLATPTRVHCRVPLGNLRNQTSSDIRMESLKETVSKLQDRVRYLEMHAVTREEQNALGNRAAGSEDLNLQPTGSFQTGMKILRHVGHVLGVLVDNRLSRAIIKGLAVYALMGIGNELRQGSIASKHPIHIVWDKLKADPEDDVLKTVG